MATPAVQFFPYQNQLQRPLYPVWLPVLCGLTIICFESSPLMGGNLTSQWLADIWPAILGRTNTQFFADVHHVLRKLGHFTGYGTLGLFLMKAWHRSIRYYLHMIGSQLSFAASALSVSFTFLVGCVDEWHQQFIPGRTSTRFDVLIDTCGALLFNAIFWSVRALKRRAETHRLPQPGSAPN
jgi:VanZ family protein